MQYLRMSRKHPTGETRFAKDLISITDTSSAYQPIECRVNNYTMFKITNICLLLDSCLNNEIEKLVEQIIFLLVFVYRLCGVIIIH